MHQRGSQRRKVKHFFDLHHLLLKKVLHKKKTMRTNMSINPHRNAALLLLISSAGPPTNEITLEKESSSWLSPKRRSGGSRGRGTGSGRYSSCGVEVGSEDSERFVGLVMVRGMVQERRGERARTSQKPRIRPAVPSTLSLPCYTHK